MPISIKHPSGTGGTFELYISVSFLSFSLYHDLAVSEVPLTWICFVIIPLTTLLLLAAGLWQFLQSIFQEHRNGTQAIYFSFEIFFHYLAVSSSPINLDTLLYSHLPYYCHLLGPILKSVTSSKYVSGLSVSTKQLSGIEMAHLTEMAHLAVYFAVFFIIFTSILQ